MYNNKKVSTYDKSKSLAQDAYSKSARSQKDDVKLMDNLNLKFLQTLFENSQHQEA
jgi:hypothetical protein